MLDYEQVLDRARMMLLLGVPPFGVDSAHQNLIKSGIRADTAYFAVTGALILISRDQERREGLRELTRMTEEFGGYDAEKEEATS